MTTIEKAASNNRALSTLNLSHLKRLTTNIGVWQHCIGSEPNVRHGYSIDDVARALIVAVELGKRSIELPFVARLGDICLRFIEQAALPDGRFHNFADKKGKWLDSVGSEDSYGRTLWALAVAYQANQDFAPASRIQGVLDRAMHHISLMGSLRTRGFILQALSYLPDEMCRHAAGLLNVLEMAYYDHNTAKWQWYEPSMTYCNARVPLAMLLGSKFSDDPAETVTVALKMLDFLLKSTAQPEIGGYAPVGNNGWFKKGDKRPAIFDQQPVDAGVLVEACVAAARMTGHEHYSVCANAAMEWYEGRNIHELPMYREESGGVFDALTPYGVNSNQGAESILSYCLAAIALDSA